MQKYIIRIIPGVLLAFAIIMCTFNGVTADGMIIPDPTPEEIGYPQIKYHFVNVDIQNQYAITQVDQEFYNPYNETLVGTYIFPVPEGAVLSNFTLNIDEKEEKPQIMAANEAKELFQQTVIEMDDASLLQYLDNNIFSLEVTIPPKSSKQITLEYEEILTMNGGMYRYTYTLSAEYYTSSNIDNVSITIHITSDDNIDTIYSSTHPITTERIDSKEIFVYYNVKNARPDKDFELFYSVTEKDFGASLLTYDSGDENFFMLFLNSNAEIPEEYIPKDIIFVIDKSGSMSGEKISQARDALIYILQKLGNDDRFNIIDFDNGIYTFSENLESVNSKTIEEALDYVNNIDSGGSTNINDALLTAIETIGNTTNTETPRIVFFLTDGLPTAGVTDEESITQNVKDANIVGEVDASIFVFGVGYDVNTHLLDKISNENHGGRVYVDPDESIETALTELYNKIQNPLLIDISIEFDGMEVYETFPKDIPNLYEGSEIVLLGKYDSAHTRGNGPEEVRVDINGSKGEERVELVFDLKIDSDSRNNFIPRIWATRKIGVLMDQIKLEGETEELKEEIKALGLKYGIVTPYTSLLITEQEEGLTDGMGENQEDKDGDGMADAWEKSGSNSNSQSYMNDGYQQSSDVYETTGANIQAYGDKIFAEINGTFIDLELLMDITTIELKNESLADWILANLNVTRFITFGSEEYFGLLKNDDFIKILPVGTEVVFGYDNEVYYISHGEISHSINNLEKGVIDSTVTITWYTNKLATSCIYYRTVGQEEWGIKQESTLLTRHKFTFELPDGNYEFYISSQDKYGNEVIDNSSGSYYEFSIPNALPPLLISNVNANVTGTTVSITWETNDIAVGVLAYRPKGTAAIWEIEFEADLAQQHSIVITSLDFGVYEYYVSSTDTNGNTVADDTIRFWEIESPDKDIDGLPDEWERRYGLNPSNPDDSFQDNDGDGYTNLEEYRLDSDPMDSNSPYSSPEAPQKRDPDQWNILIWIIIIIAVFVIVCITLAVRNIQNKKKDEEYYQDYQDERTCSKPFDDEFENWDNKYDEWKPKKRSKKGKKRIKKTKKP